MTLKKIILNLIFFISLNCYPQKIFEELGNREYSDTLNTELLQKVCDNLDIKYSNIFIEKSHSISFNSNITFFALQYVIDQTKNGKLYTTKYAFVHNSDFQIIDQIDDSESYYDKEAVQISPSYILKNKIKFNNDVIGIGIITEESTQSCATLYSQQEISIISLFNSKIRNLLDSFPIRKTQGESNCFGNYEIEILEKSIDIMESKTNGLFDLFVTKTFTYENVIEENPKENIKAKKIVKNKTETEKLIFNGKKYDFQKEKTLRFLKW